MPDSQEEIVQTLILTLHIIVCVLLVILILLQSGKEGMGVIFGGGNASVFGSSGAGSILAKLTPCGGYFCHYFPELHVCDQFAPQQ